MKLSGTQVLTRTVCLMSLLAALLTTRAQEKLKPNPQKAKDEMEAYQRQKTSGNANPNNPRQTPEYNILKKGDLMIIKFSDKSKISVKDFFQFFEKQLGFEKNNNFVFSNETRDSDGYVHYHYEQFYKGIKVKGGQFVLHEQNGKLKTASGKFFQDLHINAIPAINKENAIQRSKQLIGAKKYRWENKDAEMTLKKQRKDSNATYYPKPELIIAPKNNIYKSENFRLAYKVSVSTEQPFDEIDIYIDAQSGEVLHKHSQIKHSDEPALGTTLYSGLRNFTTDSYSGFYRLQESGRPIITKNMLNGIDYSKAATITNRFNNKWGTDASELSTVIIKKVNKDWQDILGEEGNAPDIYIEIVDITGTVIYSTVDNVIPNASFPQVISLNRIKLLHKSKYTIKVYDKDAVFDDLLGSFDFESVNSATTLASKGSVVEIYGNKSVSGAIDAHWGMERVYDYYSSEHQRESFDGSNSDIEVYVHLNKSTTGGDPNNAFWLPSEKNINFLDGDGVTEGQQAALDVCGHEFTHGVIQHNGNNGFDDSGDAASLEESFGDIFGTAVEFSVPGYAANWTFSEKTFLSTAPTPFKYTRSLSNPKDKGHPDTYRGTNWSTAPMHARAGVQNKWFYLLSNGGNGNIDGTGFRYEVPSISRNVAAKITYENMMNQLMSSATYEEAYLGSLEAAEKLNYSTTSTQYRAVREAWFAVGVAKRPVITSFSPTHGPEGTTVIIDGANFDGISYVGFNNTYVSGLDFTVNANATQIVVSVPAGATTGFISIIAGYDTVSTDPNKFTVDCKAPLTVTVSSSDATSFTANVTGGTPPYMYSIDNTNFQTSNVFTNLASGRSYTVYAKDSVECKGQVTFFLSNPINCNVQSGSGGQGTSFITQNLGATPGSVTVSYQMYTIPDQMDVYYDNQLVASTNALVSGAGNLQFNYVPKAGGPYHCIIRLYAPNAGTAWDFIAYCPVSLFTQSNNSARIQTLPYEPGNGPRFILSPNPATNLAILNIGGVTGKAVIKISDITGKELWKTERTNGNINLPTEQLAAGVYVVTIIYNDDKKRSLKLIKIRK